MQSIFLWSGLGIALLFVALGVRLFMIEKKLRRLFGGSEEKTVAAIVSEHAALLEKARGEIRTLHQKEEYLEQRLLDAVQKVAMVRFNPFSDSGGDQSFAIAMLDANNTGVVLSSLFVQNRHMVYGKPIEKGKSQYALSSEEQKVLERAIAQ